MEFLNRGKANANVVGIGRFKILDGRNAHAAVADDNVLIEEIFDGRGIEKIVFGFLDNVGRVDEEKEIAIALFVKIQNQSRHDERLAASRCHIEQEMQRIGFARIVVFIAMEKSRKGVNLIAAQFVAGIEILRDASGDFLFEKAHFQNGVKGFVEKLRI